VSDFDALYVDDEIDEESLQELRKMRDVIVCEW